MKIVCVVVAIIWLELMAVSKWLTKLFIVLAGW